MGNLIRIAFPDRETEKRVLGFLPGRFSGRILKSGEHLVPEAVLDSLARQNIALNIMGETSQAGSE
ncbi:MAG: hypothetical protein U0992_00305 [Planctomycetaceae bacterium]